MLESVSPKAMIRTSVALALVQGVGLALYIGISLNNALIREYLAEEPTWILLTLALIFPLLSAISCLAVFLAARARFLAALLPAAIAVYGQAGVVVSSFSNDAFAVSWTTALLTLTSAALFAAILLSFSVGLASARRKAAA